MGKVYHDWSESEIKFLEDNYMTKTPQQLATELKLPHKIVQRLCWRLGFVRNPRWLDEDKEYLKQHYPLAPMEQLQAHLKRTPLAIRRMSDVLKIKRLVVATKVPIMRRRRTPKKGDDKKDKPKSRRWQDNKLVLKPFDPTGKKVVRVDARTFIYVPIAAAETEVQKMITSYRKLNNYSSR